MLYLPHPLPSRSQEAMKMMGLSNWVHWSAWFIKYFIYLTITVSLMTVMFCIKVGDLKASVVTNSDPSIIFVFLMMYAVVSMMYSFAISALFSKGMCTKGQLFPPPPPPPPTVFIYYLCFLLLFVKYTFFFF